MNLNLTDKVAVVTGASRGIGRAIAQFLAQEGMRLVLAARSAEMLDETTRNCGVDYVNVATDLREEHAPRELIEQARQKFGRMDLLVNNAGATQRGDFLHLTEEAWRDGFALKFYSAVRCARAAWPHLVETRGSIVNIIGVGGRTGHAEFAIGGAVNAALLNLTKVLADKGIQDGVRVNAINPGAIKTERLKTRVKKLADEKNIPVEEAERVMAKQLGVRRFGEPPEIAAAVAFLASEQAQFCQGSILDIDGGETRTL